MKLRLLCIALAVLLTGCSLAPQKVEVSTWPPASVTEPATAPATQPTELQPTESQPPETEPPATEPMLPEPGEPADEDFVRIRDYIPTVSVELAYATQKNFTGQKIYDFTDAWLRYGTVLKLMAVQAELETHGLYLKIWDGFRPVAAQFALWEVCPINTYVANPITGYSSHSRGNTVDVTLVNANGFEIDMPTAFDEFSKKADRDYSDCTPEAAANATLLENIMVAHGFRPHYGEWWHYADTTQYPVEESFQPVMETGYVTRQETALQKEPDSHSLVLVQIPEGAQVRLLARYETFSYVSYYGVLGYVSSQDLESTVQPRMNTH